MRKITIFLLLLLPALAVRAQEKNYDTVALVILDRMSDVIGELSSCSYVLDVGTDRQDSTLTITSYNRDEVWMVGPNKMFVDARGIKGHRAFFYNGSKLTYYSFDENNYAAVDAPSTILETIDSIHAHYDIDFPAADFFYPSFTDDLLDNFNYIDYLGIEKVNAVECFHIVAKGKNMEVQLWIANNATSLPVKFIINYNNPGKDIKRYEATFSDWKLNLNIPESVFEFLQPPHAQQVHLMPVKRN
jgi:hypothetical protein